MDTSSLTELWEGLSFNLPLEYYVLVLGILALCLIWGRYKMGILATFASFLYWGYLANKNGVLHYLEQNTIGMLVAMFIGMGTLFMIIMTVFEEHR